MFPDSRILLLAVFWCPKGCTEFLNGLRQGFGILELNILRQGKPLTEFTHMR